MSDRGPRDLEARFVFGGRPRNERIKAERKERARVLAERLRSVTDEAEMMALTHGANIGTVRLQELRQAWREGRL